MLSMETKGEEVHKDHKQVLDHGFVRLVDTMGDDSAIVQAARVSYGAGTKTPSDDRGLIRYLMRHKHTTPLEMCEIKLHCKMPIFVARQWIRHRTASVNEYSARYSILKSEFYHPDEWKTQSKTNKQGTAQDVVSEPLITREARNDEHEQSFTTDEVYASRLGIVSKTYDLMLENNTARELARVVLPLSTYTEWYWKIDLHNLLHFLQLRLDTHAQYEIRVYAEAIAEMVKEWVPDVWEAFEDYRLHACTFSRMEMEVLRCALDYHLSKPEDLTSLGITKREWIEFEEKLNG